MSPQNPSTQLFLPFAEFRELRDFVGINPNASGLLNFVPLAVRWLRTLSNHPHCSYIFKYIHLLLQWLGDSQLSLAHRSQGADFGAANDVIGALKVNPSKPTKHLSALLFGGLET